MGAALTGRDAASARQQLVSLLEGLQRKGVSVLDLVRGGQPQEPWRLYPGETGIFDRQTRCQFYFHSHDSGSDEAGHFHTVRLFPDHTVHVVGISMAENGWPQSLFTVNAWATGERPEPRATVKEYARRFRLDERRGPRALVRFVNLVFRVFLPEIERAQDEKEAALADYRRVNPGRDPLEDRALDVLSRITIQLRDLSPVGRQPGAPRSADLFPADPPTASAQSDPPHGFTVTPASRGRRTSAPPAAAPPVTGPGRHRVQSFMHDRC